MCSSVLYISCKLVVRSRNVIRFRIQQIIRNKMDRQSNPYILLIKFPFLNREMLAKKKKKKVKMSKTKTGALPIIICEQLLAE